MSRLLARLAAIGHEVEVAHVEVERLEAELERYRAALVRIANAESGVWGTIAHEALHPPTETEVPDETVD